MLQFDGIEKRKKQVLEIKDDLIIQIDIFW